MQPTEAVSLRSSRILSGLTWTMVAVGLAVAQAGHGAPPISIGFEESEGFTVGSGIEEIEGWSSGDKGDGVITREDCLFGEQSLKIEANERAVEIGYLGASVPQAGVRFIELAVKPVPIVAENATATLNLWGSKIGFVRGDDDTIYIHLPEGTNGERKAGSIATLARADVEGQSGPWLHLVLRQDLATAKWDLYLDGKPVAVDLLMARPEGSLRINVGAYEAMHLDGIGIGTENPLFTDSDGDGMPDAYEVAHRLNPHLDDRNGDRDGDGISNIDEFLAGTPPNVVGSVSAGQILYVDNVIGNDANSGFSYQPGGHDGPKASIKAAMAAAKNGAVIVVMPGSGVYDEGSRSAKGKRITIRSVKPIIIK